MADGDEAVASTQLEPAASESWWDALKKYDWLKIPGATRSIARLVGSFGDLGSAWIEVGTIKAKQVHQGIVDDTAARKAISAAVAKKAAKTAADDPEIVQLHMEAWAGERVRKQENKAEIALLALEQLESDPPPADAIGPDDDWLNVFEAHAEKASSDRLRNIWARVLAGEIRNAGAFSYKTMEFVSLLDQSVAQSLHAISHHILRGDLIVDPARYNFTPDFGRLSLLQEYGLVETTEKQRRLTFPANGHILLEAGNRLGIILRGTPAAIVDLQVYLLTRVGREVVRIIDRKDTVDSVAEEASRLSSRSEFTHIFVCTTKRVTADITASEAVIRIVKQPPPRQAQEPVP